MGNMALELISALTLLSIIFYLWSFGKKSAEISRSGCLLIITGFFLVFIGRLVDAGDDFWLLEEYLESTVYETVLEDVLGGIVGYLLIGAGLLKWMPTLSSVETLKNEVSEREAAQEKLGRERSLLSGLLTSIPDAVFFKDAEGTYLGCNPAFSKLVKRQGEEVVGRKARDLYPESMANFIGDVDKECFEKGKVSTVEKWIDSPDNSHVFLQTVRAPLYDEAGSFIGIVGVSRDITGKKLAEEAVLKARLAEDSSKTRNEFLSTMSHELRTPLNSIIGFSDLLLEGSFGPLNERQTKYIQNVHNSGKRLLKVINDILDLSKVEAGKTELEPETFRVANVLDEIERVSGPRASAKKLTLKFRVDKRLTTITADKMRFKQVLYNLISNAIKFTPEGGTVTLSAEKAGNILRVSVADTGIGISKKDQEYLFQPFKQLDYFLNRRYEGTGLGLALVKRFVEMHGGKVRVESEPGKGSVFTFELPADGVVSLQNASGSQAPLNLS